MDYSLPGSSVHGILQARVLEWVANKGRRLLMTSSISQMTSTATSAERGHLFLTVPAKIQGRCVHSRARLCDPVNCQSPLSVGFPRQEYCSGLPFPSPGDLPNPGIKQASLATPALSGRFFSTHATWNPYMIQPGEELELCQSPAGHMHHKWARCIIPKRNPVLLPRKHKQLLSPTWTLTVYVESSTNNNHFSNPRRLGGGKRGSQGRGDINTWSWFILLYIRN